MYFTQTIELPRSAVTSPSVREELQFVPPSKLAIESVSKTFRSRTGPVQALDRVSLQVGEGEFVCLVGAKSTPLEHHRRIGKPDSGSVTADGLRVTEPGRERLVCFRNQRCFHGSTSSAMFFSA